MKMNHDNFDNNKIIELKALLIANIKRNIISDKEILKQWLNDGKYFYKTNHLSLSQTIEDLINFSGNYNDFEDKYNICEYLTVKKIYDDSLKVLNKSIFEKRDYLEQLFLFWSLEENKKIQTYIPKVHLLADPSTFNNEISTKKKFKDFIEQDLFKVFLDFNEVCKKIFDYYKYLSPIRAELISAMNLKVCPYCNENNIHIFDQNVLADLDHFLLQSQFPLFALTFSNFIPSCSICNRTLKGTFNGDIMNPFLEGFNEDATFKFESPPIKFSEVDFKLGFSINNDSLKESSKLKIVNSIELFELKKRYNHENIAKVASDIYYKSKILTSNPQFLEISNLKEEFNKEELLNMFLGFDPNMTDIINIQYGKLKLDILKYCTTLT